MRPLPRSTPAAEGLDPAAVDAFLAAQADQEMHSLVVLRHGRIVHEQWWTPWLPSDQQLVYSLSKTFTSAAVGLCVAEGRFGYDDRVVDLLPHLVGSTSGKTRRLRVRDCLAMASGHEHDLLDLDGFGPLDDRLVTRMLATAPEGEPGETFCYNQLPPYTMSVLVQHATGLDLLDYLRPRLFDHLTTDPVHWLVDRQGRSQGFSGIQVTTGTLAAFFQLLLDDGVADGVQVLPPEWVARHRERHVATGGEDRSDWAQGYGWYVWRSRHGYRGDGAFGQYGVVLPEQDAVVVITSHVADMQVTLDNLWTHLLPGFAPSPAPAGAAPDVPVPHRVEAVLPPLDAPFEQTPAGGVLPVRFGHELLDGTPWLTWTERDGAALRCPVGEGQWDRHELRWPEGRMTVATSGVRVGDQVHARLCLVNTPHSLDVVAGPGGWARWRLAPLGVVRSLRDLCIHDRTPGAGS